MNSNNIQLLNILGENMVRLCQKITKVLDSSTAKQRNNTSTCHTRDYNNTIQKKITTILYQQDISIPVADINHK